MHVTVFCATSLDGFLAREDGDVAWLGEPSEGDGDGGFADLMASVDYVGMGRNTYDKVRTFGAWPYGKPVVVLTSRSLDLPEELNEQVEARRGSPDEVVAELSARGAQRLYVDGGKTIQAFLRAGLVNDVIITTIPVLIGNGIPLFGSLHQDIRLEHRKTQVLSRGLVQTEYRVVLEPGSI